MVYAKASNIYRFFYKLCLDAISKTLKKEEYITIAKYGLERCKAMFRYEVLN